MEERYSYDQRNRLVSFEKGGMSSGYEYDAARNLLSDDRASYTYDAFNRQTKAEMFDGNIEISRYDAEGLRYEMEENGRLVQFIFRDKEVVTEEREAGTVRYIRTHELLASDAEHARTYYHYASDEMGSITHVTGGEEVLNRYSYDAWGNITEKEEAVENRFCFAGEQYDPINQQYYLRARFYNPVIGRFTQEDTYRGDGLNLYAYCQNNPVYYLDPSGYFCILMVEKILAAISEGTVAGQDLEKLKKYLTEKKKLDARDKLVAEKLGIDSKGKGNSRLSNQQLNKVKNEILAGNDVQFKSKADSVEFINKKFPDFKQEIAGSRSSEGWHFDSHPINGSTKNIDHINIYSKKQRFRVHITWGE